MAIKKVKLPNNSTVDINDARLPDVTSSDNGNILAVSSGAWTKSGLKTINNNSLLGTGNITIESGGSGQFVNDPNFPGSAYNVDSQTGEVLNDFAVSLQNGSAEGECSTSMGDGHALGNYSVAEGDSVSGGNYSHSEGNGTVASGNYSHAEGQRTKANAGASHVEGAYTYTNQQTSHAEGYNTVANGTGSHAEGGSQVYSFSCTASAGSTTITGSFTQSDIAPYTSTQFANVIKAGYVYHESNTTYRVKITDFTLTSSGSNYNYTMTTETALSTSALSGNIKVVWQYAYGNYSHSEGSGTVAYGSRSHAEGYATCAFGDYSHTEGQQTYTSNTAEHACGKYNKSTSSVTQFSVGVGTSSTRKNALEINASGDVYVKGIGSYDGTNVTASGVQDLATVINSGSNGLVIHEVSDSGSTTAGTWKATASGVTALTDGLTIRYKLVVAGAATTTLNLNNLGAKTVYRFNTTKLTTHYAVGSYIILTYNSSLNSGCWITVDGYDSNSDNYVRQYVASDNNEYSLLARYATTSVSSYEANYARFADGVTVNPSTDTITASGFKVTGGTSSQVLTANGSTRSITISSSEPTSGTGSDGDIWIVI